jgi:hypothetical protein
MLLWARGLLIWFLIYSVGIKFIWPAQKPTYEKTYISAKFNLLFLRGYLGWQ